MSEPAGQRFGGFVLVPALLGLLSPLVASAAPSIALDKYSSADDQVTSISQFSDVRPTDWAYQALSALVGRTAVWPATPTAPMAVARR